MHKKIFLLSLPLILSNVALPLVGIVNTALIGHLHNSDYLAATTLGVSFVMLICFVFAFFRMSMTGLIAQKVNRTSVDDLAVLVTRALIVAFVIAVFVLLIKSLLLMIYLSIIVADTTVVAMVANFYNVGIYLITFYLVNYIFIGFFIGVGKTKIIFYSSLVTMISAVCLSILFILQCDMNLMGVAYSLLIAYGITSVFLIVCTARYFASNNLDCKKLYQLMNLLSYKEYIPFLRLNSDIFIRSVCLLLSFNSFYIFSSSYGSDVLSANAILIEISLFMAMFLDALANVTESMVGQAYVDKNKKYFKEVIVKTFIQCMLITLFFVIVYVIFKNQIVDLFTSIEPVKIEIDKYILFSMLLPVVASVSFWIDGVFIGMLKTIAMRNAMILSSIVYVGFVYVLFGLGNYGLWIALIIFYVARVIFLGFPLKRYLKI